MQTLSHSGLLWDGSLSLRGPLGTSRCPGGGSTLSWVKDLGEVQGLQKCFNLLFMGWRLGAGPVPLVLRHQRRCLYYLSCAGVHLEGSRGVHLHGWASRTGTLCFQWTLFVSRIPLLNIHLLPSFPIPFACCN